MTQTVTLNTTPPSLNKAYRSYRRRVILSAEAEAFKQTLSQLKPVEKVLGKIHLEIKLTFPDKRKRDLDDYLTVILDSMKHVFLKMTTKYTNSPYPRS